MMTAESCSGCGRRPDPRDQYCIECGTALTSADSNAGQGPSVVTPATATSSGARSGAGRAGRAVMAVLGLAVCFVAWTVFQAPTEQLGRVSGALNAGRQVVPVDWADGPTGRPLIAVDLTEVGGYSRFGAIPPSAAFSASLEELGVAPLELGDLAGLDDHYIVVSNYIETLLIDPGTGTIETVSPGGLVIGQFEDRLVVMTDKQIMTVPVASPLADQTSLFQHDGDSPDYIELTDNGILTLSNWLFDETAADDDGPQEPELIRHDIDLRSGEVASNPVPTENAIGPSVAVQWASGYGTYAVEANGGFRQLSAGFPAAHGQDNILIVTCDSPDDCRWSWIDVQSGDPVDRHVPPPDELAELQIVDVVGDDDRFLLLGRERSQVYFDTLDGARYEGPLRPEWHTGLTLDAEAISPDGRYLLVPNADGLIVHDLETEESGSLTLEMTGDPLRIEMVPKAAVR